MQAIVNLPAIRRPVAAAPSSGLRRLTHTRVSAATPVHPARPYPLPVIMNGATSRPYNSAIKSYARTAAITGDAARKATLFNIVA